MGVLEDIGAFLLQKWSDIALTIFTGVVAFIAVLSFVNSVKGPDITIALDEPLPVEASFAFIAGTETLDFRFPMVIMNVGPRGGAMTGVEMTLPKSAKDYGGAPTDEIRLSWTCFVTERKQVVDLGPLSKSYTEPIFASDRQNSLSVESNESVAVNCIVYLVLKDKKDEQSPPTVDWDKVLKQTQTLELKISWKTTTRKGGMKPHEKIFKIQPKLPPKN